MSFLSIKFFLLFIVVFYTYWNVSNQYKRLILLISSCVFYSFFSFNFLLHFLFVIVEVGVLVYFAINLKSQMIQWDQSGRITAMLSANAEIVPEICSGDS